VKKVLFSALIIFICLLGSAYAEQYVSTKISEVTLFSNQALVIREGRADLIPGMNQLLVETTAFSIDQDALTAQVFGSGEMISVQFKLVPLSEYPQDQVRTIRDKLREKQQARRVLTDKKTVLEKKAAFLDGLIDFSKIQIPKDVQTSFPNMEDVRETMDFIGATASMIDTENQNIDKAIFETDREIKRLKKELAAVRGLGGTAKQAIEILFNATKNESVHLRVEYLVQRASWQPLYKVTVPANLEELKLSMLARISQKSGENWPGIGLSISNVIPMKGIHLPQLHSWNLDVTRPMPLGLKKSRAKVMAEAPAPQATTEEAFVEQDEMPAEFATAVAKELPLSFEYQIPFPVDIESRDQVTILPLLTKMISAQTFHYSVPAKNSLTFLVAEAEADQELLAGKLSVYFSGRFIGDTYLTEKKPGQSFSMNLGADRGIKVRREKILDKIKETYFGKIQRDTVVRSFAYKITAENIKDRPALLKIVDRIPVSKTDKIEIRDLQIQPKPTQENYQDKAGVHLWSFDLAAGDKGEIKIEFTVTYPKDSPPDGL
jgi:uncharacterized protein (TIGR02231 family)